jgi:RNA polymerase sigma-70 factor (ECF subfamily)
MQSLLPKIATGDPAAVEDFLKRHTGMVWGLARRFCRNAEDAEDATQEIFVDVWRSAARYDSNAGSEVTFLMTIARRRLIDRARRLGRRISADLLEDPSTIPSPAAPDAVELHDEVARAQDALERLRPEQREVLDLALGQGQTHQEIAASIGIPLGTVKSHARRGLIKLREMLGADGPEDPEPSGEAGQDVGAAERRVSGDHAGGQPKPGPRGGRA